MVIKVKEPWAGEKVLPMEFPQIASPTRRDSYIEVARSVVGSGSHSNATVLNYCEGSIQQNSWFGF